MHQCPEVLSDSQPPWSLSSSLLWTNAQLRDLENTQVQNECCDVIPALQVGLQTGIPGTGWGGSQDLDAGLQGGWSQPPEAATEQVPSILISELWSCLILGKPHSHCFPMCCGRGEKLSTSSFIQHTQRPRVRVGGTLKVLWPKESYPWESPPSISTECLDNSHLSIKYPSCAGPEQDTLTMNFLPCWILIPSWMYIITDGKTDVMSGRGIL